MHVDSGPPVASGPTAPPTRRAKTAIRPIAPPTRRAICVWLAVVLALLVAGGVAVPSAPAVAADAPAPLVVRYRAPTAFPVRVARGFVGPTQVWAAGHRGIDLDLNGGLEVLAPAAGTVTFAGTVVDRGIVTIAHADGRRSSLEPVDPGVVVGQRVEAGDLVGTLSGEGSHCTPACLHWGVREGLTYLDPLTLLPGGGPVVLLPDGE